MAETEDEQQLREYILKVVKENGGGGGSSGSADLGELGKLVRVAKDMKDAMTSEVDKALGTAVSEKIVNQVIPSMGAPAARASAGFWDSNSAVALMNKVGDQFPVIIDSVMNKIGSERTGRLVDGLTSSLGGNAGGGIISAEDNMILSFDPDNPAHMHQYMALRNLQDPNVARATLIEEKAKVMAKKSAGGGGMGGGTGGIGGGVAGGTGGGGNGELYNTIEQQNEMLRRLIQLREEDRKAFVAMYNTMETMKIEHERMKTAMGKGREGGFDIDAVKDRADTGVDVTPQPINKVSATDIPSEQKSAANDGSDKGTNKGVSEGSEVLGTNIEGAHVEATGEPVNDANEVLKGNSEGVGEGVGEVDEQGGKKAVISKRKGSPKFE